MDINVMVLNLGSSRTQMGAFVAGDLQKQRRIPHSSRAEWERELAEVWNALADADGAGVAGASVNADMDAELEQAVQRATGKEVEWVGKQLDLPIAVMTENPAQTGADRIVNVAAAFEQIQKACVVVDAGTAITVDLCDDKGRFLGGAIAPGSRLMLEALHEKTTSLPKVDLAVPAGAFGKNTQEAIRHAIFFGLRGMVRELVENYATHLGTWPDVIATGGDAKLLFEHWELIHAIAPDLTLYGIAQAYAEHHIKHGT